MAAAEPRPSVIVSHVDIVYTVFAKGGSGRSGGRRGVREVHAVKDVSFVANHGESIGIIGRNGSGKSTLLRAVAGLVPPTRGEVWADGTPSLLGVNAVLVRQLSGARNIYIGAQALGLSKAQVDDIYDEIVEFSGIGDAIHYPMSTYSSGMAARLRFAISTAAVPPVLVIDEALATGDAHFRAKSQERIEALRDQAGTVFLVSHSAATIRAMCDRAMWLDGGTLLMDGPVDDVVDAYAAAAERSLGKAAPREPEVPGVERWAGDTRYHTSALVSRQGTPGRRDTVLLASGADLPLALSAVPAAARVGAPVLLTSPGRLMPVTRKELTRLEARRVLLLGGTDVLAEDVADGVREAGFEVERVDGEDTVTTSLALHATDEGEAGVDAVYLVPGEDAQAALTAVLTAQEEDGRVLLVDPEGPTARHEEVLRRLAPRRLVVVADDRTLSDDVVEALAGLAAGGAERLLAPTPVQAAADAAARFDPARVGEVFVASGAAESVSDAVAGAAVADLADAPLLLVDRDEVPAATHTELERLRPSHVVVLGGPMAVTPSVRQALAGYLGGEEPERTEDDLDL
ncbi:cell wall-binding repeat-containing protein [Phycicoccus flavus]|uniref:ATP-binding cassette domain-containing protein n=1 Tax=Phycicoccus flavus TaxID=2502783 RepID=A0A8T6R6Z4_9MICO|nr:cell wall-binding repeat-containing protein [Phycicoccus flavus]NHA68011.1 ATP-binding cassette domain-containing protein [Phycicoccus flavus]